MQSVCHQLGALIVLSLVVHLKGFPSVHGVSETYMDITKEYKGWQLKLVQLLSATLQGSEALIHC